jgi:macrodomain Ter protein organizer (MatP/YcbG family)
MTKYLGITNLLSEFVWLFIDVNHLISMFWKYLISKHQDGLEIAKFFTKILTTTMGAK